MHKKYQFIDTNYSIPSSNVAWVAPNGNDATGNGSENSPYKTFAKALAALSSGGTVVAKSGIYREPHFFISKSNITLQAAPHAEVWLKGSDIVTNWSPRRAHGRADRAQEELTVAGNQRVYKQRIRSTQTLQKVFRAMELIASSRIGAASRNAQEASPYDHALSQAVAAVGTYAHLEHPITRERTDTNRVAVLVVTSDRGMAGAYSATVLRESERLIDQLAEEGRDPVVFTFGRRAHSYFTFRERDVEFS